MIAQSRSPALQGLALVVGIVIAWQILFEIAGENAMAPPLDTVRYLLQLLSTATFWTHLIETARAFTMALALSTVLGLATGFMLGLHRFSAEVAEPILLGLYSLPKITLYPIVLLAFGLGMPAKVAFGTIHGVMPIAIFTMSAVSAVSPVLLKTGRVLKLGPVQTIRAILFPAALPEIFTGLRIGFSLTLIGTLLGEMFGAQRGLGFLLMTAIGLQNVRVIMAVTLLLVLFAASVSTLLLVIDHRLHRRAS
jgi:NitT/TauT family transport system permease protein